MTFPRLLFLYAYGFAALAIAVGSIAPPIEIFYLLPLFGWMGCLRILLTLRLRIAPAQHLLLPLTIFAAGMLAPLFGEIRAYEPFDEIAYDFAAFHDPTERARFDGGWTISFAHAEVRADLEVSQAIEGTHSIVKAVPIVPEEWQGEEPVRFWAVCLVPPLHPLLFLASLHLENRPSRCQKNWRNAGNPAGYAIKGEQAPLYRSGVLRGARKRGVSSVFRPILLHLDPDPSGALLRMKLVFGALLFLPALLILAASRFLPPPPSGRPEPEIVLRLRREEGCDASDRSC